MDFSSSVIQLLHFLLWKIPTIYVALIIQDLFAKSLDLCRGQTCEICLAKKRFLKTPEKTTLAIPPNISHIISPTYIKPWRSTTKKQWTNSLDSTDFFGQPSSWDDCPTKPPLHVLSIGKTVISGVKSPTSEWIPPFNHPSLSLHALSLLFLCFHSASIYLHMCVAQIN